MRNPTVWRLVVGLGAAGLVAACSTEVAGHPIPPGAAPTTPAATTAPASPTTAAPRPVAAPRLVRTIRTGQTGWFASPALVDLDHDGKLEIVAPDYSTFVFSATGARLGAGTATKGRVYAPAAVGDFDGDGVTDIAVGGNDGTVAAYEFRDHRLRLKPGWPASTCSGGQCPETRALAAADLDHDGTMEIVAVTTNTSQTGSQVFVFTAAGRLYHPAGAPATSWPRYNSLTGAGNDATFNGAGNHGFAAYGENVAIGNLDDDPDLEIVVTYDNHAINVFNPDGTSVLASPWFTNRDPKYLGRRLGWGQFIRWLDPAVEQAHYHQHTGAWPNVTRTPWLQWTASPPSLGDLDGDGHDEVVGVPNVELGEPYRTQGWAVLALDGAQRGGARSARRHAGFDHPVVTGKPTPRGDGDWYPPTGIPAPTLVDVDGDGHPDIVTAAPDGAVYAVSASGRLLWRYDYAHGQPKTFGSEVVAADLNRDGVPELIFGTYALRANAGHLLVLSATGHLLSETVLPHQRHDGNGIGIGIAAAPSVGDLDGDGTLEIVTSSIDHGLDVFTVPGSDTAHLPWPTGRGTTSRTGTAPRP